MVSKSQTVLWLAGEPLKDNFQLCTQTDGQVNLIACWTATFALKNSVSQQNKLKVYLYWCK